MFIKSKKNNLQKIIFSNLFLCPPHAEAFYAAHLCILQSFEHLSFDNPTFGNPTFDNPTFDNPTFYNPTFDNPTAPIPVSCRSIPAEF